MSEHQRAWPASRLDVDHTQSVRAVHPDQSPASAHASPDDIAGVRELEHRYWWHLPYTSGSGGWSRPRAVSVRYATGARPVMRNLHRDGAAEGGRGAASAGDRAPGCRPVAEGGPSLTPQAGSWGSADSACCRPPHPREHRGRGGACGTGCTGRLALASQRGEHVAVPGERTRVGWEGRARSRFLFSRMVGLDRVIQRNPALAPRCARRGRGVVTLEGERGVRVVGRDVHVADGWKRFTGTMLAPYDDRMA